jgi:uncharacterized membrane protein
VAVERFIHRRHVSRNVAREYACRRTLGERVSDRVAQVGGSWGFITGFGAFLLVWVRSTPSCWQGLTRIRTSC